MQKNTDQPVYQVRRVAQAKLNLSLCVLDRRRDGYHNLQSIMQTLDLHDEVTLTFVTNPLAEAIESGPSYASRDFGTISVHCNNPKIASDHTNLAYRAARAWLEHFGLKTHLSIELNKNIPYGAGLGGGSSNAAAVLAGLTEAYTNDRADQLFTAGSLEQKISLADLIDIGAKIGADVPFCLVKGTAYCEGIGEIVTPLRSFAGRHLIICKPPLEVITRDAFAWLDRDQKSGNDLPCRDLAKLASLNHLLNEPLAAINELLHNDFFPSVAKRLPQLPRLCEFLRRAGSPFVRMTGSGPSVFAMFETSAARDEVYRRLVTLREQQMSASAPLPPGADLPDLRDYFITQTQTADALESIAED